MYGPCEFESNPQLLYIDKTPIKYAQIMHSHNQICEILLILSGTCQYCIGGKTYCIQEGDVVICNSDCIHDELPYGIPPYETICLGITGLKLSNLPPNHLIPKRMLPILYHPRQFQELKTLAQLMLPRNRSRESTDMRINDVLVMSCLLLTLQAADENQAIQQIDTQGTTTCIAEIIDFIDAHYMEDISLQQLSNQFHISTYRLSHLFKQTVGYSIMQYVIRRRIGEAQAMLMSTRKKISDIATQNGFSDPSHFNKTFYKFVGMTPTEYRNSRPEKVLDFVRISKKN